jgi:hypothetical protein
MGSGGRSIVAPSTRRVGGGAGLRAGFALYPNDNLAVIVLTNLQGAGPDSLLDGVAVLYLDAASKKNGVRFSRSAISGAQRRRQAPGIPSRPILDGGFAALYVGAPAK